MEAAPRYPVAVFPLPNVVLFPRARLPLHVFELRYRAMVRESLAGERLIAIALLQPGWEREYHGSPAFFPIGCLGRIDRVEWLPNDCFDLEVVGLRRVRFARIAREYPYRTAHLELLGEHPYPEDDPLVQVERQALREAFASLCANLDPKIPQRMLPPADTEFVTLVNCICTVVDMEPGEKLALLELDSVLERGRALREWLERRLRAGDPRKTTGGELN
jgi:hypothetical protein